MAETRASQEPAGPPPRPAALPVAAALSDAPSEEKP
jgi:hypothetical protein